MGKVKTPSNQTPDTIGVKELARTLKICLETAYHMVRSGRIPSKLVDGVYRIHKDDVDAYIATRTVYATDYIGITELAEILGVSHTTANTIVTTGRIPSVQVGKKFLISLKDVDEYVLHHAKSNGDLTIQELAEILNISEHSVRNYIRDGKISAKRVGHIICIPRAAVDAYLLGVQAPRKEDCIDIKQLAEILNVSYRTAYRRVASGEIHHVRVGSNYRITKADIDAYLTKTTDSTAKEQITMDNISNNTKITTENIPDVLTITDVAALLGIDYHTAYRRIRDGVIPSTQEGKHRLVSREDIETYMHYVPSEHNENYLSVQDVAAHIGIADNAVYELIKSGELPSIRIGGRHCIDKTAVIDYTSRTSLKTNTTLSVKEFAEKLNVPYAAASDIIRKGKVRAVRVGKHYRVPVDAVDEYLQSPYAQTTDDCIGTKEFAEILGIPYVKARDIVMRGQIHSTRTPGGRYRIPREAVAAYLQNH